MGEETSAEQTIQVAQLAELSARSTTPPYAPCHIVLCPLRKAQGPPQVGGEAPRESTDETAAEAWGRALAPWDGGGSAE